MNDWAASIPRSQTDALLTLRDVPDVRVATDGEWLWISGPGWSATIDRLLCGIPNARRFRLHADGRLTPVNATLATARLPTLAWSPLRLQLTLGFPLTTHAGPAEQAGAPMERMAVRLIRASEAADPTPSSANLLLTTVEAWCGFVEQSPRALWEQAAFAADSHGRCLVRAADGIAVRGERWRERDGIAAPLGWRWEPEVAPRVLQRLWLLDDGDLALWFPDNRVERIEAASFVRASRSAARDTRRRLLPTNSSTSGEPRDDG